MGVIERREREREEVRQKILDAARELFAAGLREGHDAQDRRGHRVLPDRDLPALRGQGRPRAALCRQEFGRLLAVFESQAAPDPVERIRALGPRLRAFAHREPQPLPVHVHDSGEGRAHAEPTDPGSTPSNSCGPRSIEAVASGGCAAGTWTRSRRSSGPASTGRYRCSSPCGPTVAFHGPPARTSWTRRSTTRSAASSPGTQRPEQDHGLPGSQEPPPRQAPLRDHGRRAWRSR